MSNTSASSVGASRGGSLVSASAIVAPVVESGSHILRIDGYSRTKGLGNGEFMASETFAAGGSRWCLRYYPDGTDSNDSDSDSAGSDSDSDSDCMTILLHLVRGDADKVEAKYTISLLDQDGNVVPSYSYTGQDTFKASSNHTWGFDLIKRNELEESVYLKDDVFFVRCDVAVLKEKMFTKAVPVSEVFHAVIRQDR
ncbi:BTB/POZ and MATH domain-containing protein 2-like [Aegilops tauschii subsp. strangulata]|uniref:Uncharacterized protein n=1 Tax=Aegilops tauschii TaxID=37682 RepID=M8D6K9_AEGTA|nr:BTB/POZ and MATH domain-containing protein 2-like [Aegilops tauschii subsp. strangulata]